MNGEQWENVIITGMVLLAVVAALWVISRD
jgi:hypothetical protein